MKLIAEIRNKAFDQAFTFVESNYSGLFHPTIEICLLKAYRHDRGALGTHTRINPTRSRITIKNGKYSIPEFVDTLVHELTHAQQHISGRADSMSSNAKEHEAGIAGYAAMRKAFETWPDGWPNGY